MVIYPFWPVGLILNLMAITGTLYLVVKLVRNFPPKECHIHKHMLKTSLKSNLCSVIVSLMTVVTIALIWPRPAVMCWYSRPWLILPIYVLPAFSSAFYIQAKCFEKFQENNSCFQYSNLCIRTYDISFTASLLICSVFILTLSFFKIASSYILCIWVLVPICVIGILNFLDLHHKFNIQSYFWFIRHGIVTFLPTLYHFYVTDPIFELFVPILGRSGGHVQPELFISVLVFLVTIIPVLFHSPLVFLCGGNIKHLMIGIWGLFFTVLITTICTPLGNPYDIGTSVHVQRSYTALTLQRVQQNSNTSVRSGIWFVPMDYNGISSLYGFSTKLDSYLEKITLACSEETDLRDHPYCGLPYFFPASKFVDGKTWWLDIALSEQTMKETYWPKVLEMPISPLKLKSGTWLYQFRVDCGETPQCSLYLTPLKNSKINRWLFSNIGLPLSNFPLESMVSPPAATDLYPEPTWFVMLRFGSASNATRIQQRSMIVTIEMAVSDDSVADSSAFKLAIVNHYFKGSSLSADFKEIPQELDNFVSALPNWHFTIPLTSFYSSYSF